MKYLAILLALIPVIAEARMVSFAWDASPDATVTGYRLYYWTPALTTPVTQDCGNATTCSVDVPTGVALTFAVTAYNSAGLESDFSNTVKYFEMYGTPISLISVKGGGLDLVWLQGPDFVKAYQITQGVGYGTNVTWNSTNIVVGYTNNFAQVGSLVRGTNFFRVRPVFDGGTQVDYTSGYSATASVAPPSSPVLRIVPPSENIIQKVGP